MTAHHTTTSEAETAALGRSVAAGLRRGDIVLLRGPLGAGKTAFVRGLAEGLGCDASAVTSPTFTIIQEYAGTTTLQHVDLYRLAPPEVDDLGLEDLLEECVLAVEWAERWHGAPAAALDVTLMPAGGDRRDVTIYSTR